MAPWGATARRGRGFATGIAAALLAAGLLGVVPVAQARGVPESFADTAEALLPAVVNISTTQTISRQDRDGERGNRNRRGGPEIPQFPPGSPFEEFFKDFFDRDGNRGQRPDSSPRRATSLGSGFIIDSAGYVVTNKHVIEGADADGITVKLHDDTDFKAALIGKDDKTDLALLKINPGNRKLVAVKFGDSAKARVGDWVLAIGNPFGLGGSVTAGIVSARARDINAGPYDDFIQTDASINKGNSGGPLFNMNGEVIGVNTAIYSPTGGSIGIGFSVASNLAKPIIDQLREFRRTKRGWLGVKIQGVTDEIAESLGLGKARGAMIAAVTEGGPAEKAKLRQGDIILSFDGKDVNEMRRLPRVVAETPVDREVPVQIWRDGKLQTLTVRVGELDENDQVAAVPAKTDPTPQQRASSSKIDALGIALAPISQELRQKFEIDQNTTQGVVVTEVEQNGPAAEKGVVPGDIIVEVGQEEVKTPADIKAKVDKARQAGRKSVLLLVDRRGEMRFIALRIDKG